MTASRVDRRGPHRGDERRTALLEALDHYLQDSSLESINIADVSRRAGVTRSAFYFYFENKAYAVAALMGEIYDEASSATRLLLSQDGDPATRVRAVIRRLLDAVDAQRHVYKAMFEARATNDTVRSLWDADRESFVEPVARMITAEREAGRAPGGVDATALATVLLELNDRALERFALGSSLPRDAHEEALVTVWLRAVYASDPTTTA